MSAVELNLKAKPYVYPTYKLERQRKMRRWRKMKELFFTDKKDFNQWLFYTNWHKRPVKLSNEGFMLKVTFLDDMKGAK